MIEARSRAAERLLDHLDALSLRMVKLAAIEAALKAEADRAFDQGFILAVAEIMRQHGEDVIAADILRANRPKTWTHIDECDRKALQPIFDHEAMQKRATIRNGD